MKIQLVDKNIEMCNQWKIYFDNCIDIMIFNGDFFILETNCVVSPANSFGFMDGGLDYIILKKFGAQVQTNLQNQIRNKYFGELLVGQAELIRTGNKKIPYLISAPTMRVPMIIKNTVNVYLATKAIFYLLKNINAESRFYTDRNLIDSITISGLGTGVGQVPYDICAKQMKQAYDDIWLNKYVFPNSYFESQKQHQLLYSDNYVDLQF